MQTYESLKRTVWECKYHVVFIPKCHRKVLYGELGAVFRSLAEIGRAELSARFL